MKTKIAFIGGGINSAIGHTHISSCLIDGLWQIQPSYFSQTKNINEATHSRYCIPWRRHFETYRHYLDDFTEPPDLIAVLTPSPTHFDMVCEILERKIPLLIEKPIVCNRDQAGHLLNLLKSDESLFVRYVHNYSHYPLFKEMEIKIHQGAIGSIHHIIAKAPSDGYARTAMTGLPQKWRQQDSEIPMLALDLGTHLYHLVHRLIKDDKGSLIANANQLVSTFGVIDNMTIQCETNKGCLIDYWFSKSHLGVKNGLAIEAYGESGSLRWYQESPDNLIYSTQESNPILLNRGSLTAELAALDRFKPGHPTGFVEAMGYFYQDLHEDLINFIDHKSGNKWINRAENACSGILFLDNAYQSALKRKWMHEVTI